ncbi:MAG: hypothetical protein FJX47_17990 [Alphaproteobacteria bacterium]|nr:hypothetical protein [Alphaproteobacteria bacterium]
MLRGTLAGALPADPKEQVTALDRTIQDIDATIALLPEATQSELGEAFDLLALAPGRWLLLGLWPSWESASEADLTAAMEGLKSSRFALKRNLYFALHGLSMAGWYGNPASWAAIGYPGPPDVPRPA